VVGCPTDPLRLSVRRGFHPEDALRRSSLIDVESINPVRVGAVDQEEIDLAVVRSRECAKRVRPRARRLEADPPPSQTPGLALGAEKAAPGVDDEVVAVICPVRGQDAVSPADQFGEDDRLCALPYVDRVRAGFGGSIKKRTDVRILDRQPDGSRA
jgi:hypothetical protein